MRTEGRMPARLKTHPVIVFSDGKEVIQFDQDILYSTEFSR